MELEELVERIQRWKKRIAAQEAGEVFEEEQAPAYDDSVEMVDHESELESES